MARVILENLAKNYPEKTGPGITAVRGIDLTIADGEFMVLVGPSGCGKSTTLRMIAGLEEISSGTVSIDERVVNDVLPKDRRIAMVFQNYALYPHMSVRENLAFGLKLRKLPVTEIETRVRQAATLLQIEHLLDRRPKALSGGQRQRVAVGRAIVRQPKVFLFDEPLSNLDAKMRVSTRTEISKLHARLGATMVYVTHDQVEAMTMGDRICVMNDGRIMQVATPLKLYNQPANMFVAGFIGSPPMNFFHGRMAHGERGEVFVEHENPQPFQVPFEADRSPTISSLTGRAVVLGIRPEDIHEVTADGPTAHGTATVEISEPMGAETLLYLTTGTTSFIARVGPTDRYRPGDRFLYRFNIARARLFDAETQQQIA